METSYIKEVMHQTVWR